MEGNPLNRGHALVVILVAVEVGDLRLVVITVIDIRAAANHGFPASKGLEILHVFPNVFRVNHAAGAGHNHVAQEDIGARTLHIDPDTGVIQDFHALHIPQRHRGL